MTFLFVVKQKKNVDTFEAVIAALLGAGHRVTLAVQERDEVRDRKLADRFKSSLLTVVPAPAGRGDRWRSPAPLVRAVRDLAQYTRPEYRQAGKLRQRAVSRLLKELGATGRFDVEGLGLPQPAAERVRATLAMLERAIPSDPLHDEFLQRHAPDAVVITPGIHFGSVQSDIAKSARAAGVPVWMLVFSWDNLSTKGALHVVPDRMFVWNELQRREAAELHDFPTDRVVVVGAPRFDGFFALRPTLTRQQFCAPLGLDPARPLLLYVCSSRFIASRELPFIERWLAGVRASSLPLARSSLIVRPHPDLPLLDDTVASEAMTWPGMPPATGWVSRPFDDPAALVLRTAYSTPQSFYESLHHAAAVVGLNTSAELEAGIVGRPVLTTISHDEGADGQTNTLHFSYLLKEHGGFVDSAPDLATHFDRLNAMLSSPPDPGPIRAFIDQFLRPLGPEPVAPLLARQLVDQLTSSGAVADLDAAADVSVAAVSAADVDERPPDAQRKLLRVDLPGAEIQVHATPETRRWRRRGVYRFDPAILAWFAEQLRPGDVFYDVGAGVGAYAILAATQRGALSVAFEPGFAAFAHLCDNILLNGCYRSVIPMPVTLGDRAGLSELSYPHDAGSDVHVHSGRRWKPGQDRLESHYSQPVMVDRLDDVVVRQGLPRPHVMRVAIRSRVDHVLHGAADVLRGEQFRSVVVAMKTDEHVPAILDAVKGLGFSETLLPPNRDFGRALYLVRTAAPPASGLGTLRRAASHLLRPRR